MRPAQTARAEAFAKYQQLGEGRVGSRWRCTYSQLCARMDRLAKKKGSHGKKPVRIDVRVSAEGGPVLVAVYDDG